jgi:hypothetical protein
LLACCCCTTCPSAGCAWSLLCRQPRDAGIGGPEDSHLSRTCATVFTDAYVRAVAGLSPALTVRAAAPPPLSAADCNAAVPRRHATSAAVGKPTDP